MRSEEEEGGGSQLSRNQTKQDANDDENERETEPRCCSPIFHQPASPLISQWSPLLQLLGSSELDQLTKTFEEGDHGCFEATVLEEAGDEVGGSVAVEEN